MARLNALNILNSLVGLYDASSQRTLAAKQFEQQKKRDDLNMLLRRRQLEKLDEEDDGPAETRTINVGDGKTENQTYRNGNWETDSTFDRWQPSKPVAAKPTNHKVVTKNGVQHIIDMNDPANLGVFGAKAAPGGAVEGNKPSHFTAGVMNAASAWRKNKSLTEQQVRNVIMAYGDMSQPTVINGNVVPGTPDKITQSMYGIAMKEAARMGLAVAGGAPPPSPAPPSTATGDDVSIQMDGQGNLIPTLSDVDQPRQVGFGSRTPQQNQVWSQSTGPDGQTITSYDKPEKPILTDRALGSVERLMHKAATHLFRGTDTGVIGSIKAKYGGLARQAGIPVSADSEDFHVVLQLLALKLAPTILQESGRLSDNDRKRMTEIVGGIRPGMDADSHNLRFAQLDDLLDEFRAKGVDIEDFKSPPGDAKKLLYSLGWENFSDVKPEARQ